jgi:acyl-CoA reductase-like NAD-dependent aldehyde dehydrogenase
MEPTKKSYKLLVAGEWIEDNSALPVIDKYTGEVIATVPAVTRETVERAIAAAHAAFPAYSRTPAHMRSHQGAKVLIGEKREGKLFYPTLLSNVRPNMKVMCVEAFAPIVSIYEYANFEDAVKMIEESPGCPYSL